MGRKTTKGPECGYGTGAGWSERAQAEEEGVGVYENRQRVDSAVHGN